jgi:oligopeptide transport system substrate-binding protein
MGIVPAASAADPTAFDLPVGSGPFRVNTRDATSFGLVRSPGSTALVDEITLRVFPDGPTAQVAWDAGELDASVLAADAVAAATANGDVVVSAPKHVSLFYGMNVGAPILSSLPFRQAILKAIDVDTLRREVFGDTADTMTGPIGPGVPSRRQAACTSSCAYDPEAAKQLLVEAFGTGAPPAIHVDYFDEPTGREAAIATAIAEDLNAVGIPAQARVHSFDSYQQVLTSGNAELFRFGWIGAYPAADAYLEPLFASSGSDNLFNVADPALDGLLAAMDAAADATARNSFAIEAEDRVLALSAIVPLVQLRSHLVTTDAVGGVVLAPNGTFDVERVTVGAP